MRRSLRFHDLRRAHSSIVERSSLSNRQHSTRSALGQTEKNSVRAYVFRFALELGHCSMQSACRKRPSRPGEFHPEPLTDPDLTLSRHPARAAARRLPPSVENWSSSCCQLARSQRRWPAPFAPRALPRFNTTTGQSAPLRRIGTFGLAVGAACALYGAFEVKHLFHGILHFLHSSFFVRFGIPFLRSDLQYCKADARRSCQGWPSPQ